MKLHYLSSQLVLEARRDSAAGKEGDYDLGTKTIPKSRLRKGGPDPHPFYLILGTYDKTKKNGEVSTLHAAINLNYVESKYGITGINTIRVFLPQILRYSDDAERLGKPRELYGPDGRYWMMRNGVFNIPGSTTGKQTKVGIFQDIMTNMYRTPKPDLFKTTKSSKIPSMTPEEFMNETPGELANLIKKNREEEAEAGLPPEKPPEEKLPPEEEPPEEPPEKPMPTPPIPGEKPEVPEPEAPEVPEVPEVPAAEPAPLVPLPGQTGEEPEELSGVKKAADKIAGKKKEPKQPIATPVDSEIMKKKFMAAQLAARQQAATAMTQSERQPVSEPKPKVVQKPPMRTPAEIPGLADALKPKLPSLQQRRKRGLLGLPPEE